MDLAFKMKERIKTLKNERNKKVTQKEIAYHVWKNEIDSIDDPRARDGELERKRKVIQTYLHGTIPREPDVFIKLSEALDCDLEYLFDLQTEPRRSTREIEELTNLSELASTNLRIAADSYKEDINLELAKESYFHDFEVGKKSKLLFLQHLLENSDEWEKISVSYFDYKKEIEKANIAPYELVHDVSHEQFAEIYISKAQAALRGLFELQDERRQ